MNQLVSLLILLGMLLSHIVYVIFRDRRYDRLIEAQQATIQKLLNREPVTYKEVGQEQPKADTDSYSAWGSQVISRDDSTS